MIVSRYIRTGALIALVAAGLAACGESPLAPVPESPALSPAASEPLLARGRGGDRWRSREYGTVTFTIRPNRAVLERLGKHVLYIPANVTCDPATSGYGLAHFDLPCDVAKRPIKVTAKWVTVDGEQAIRFEPDLRFQPQVSRRDWVMLWAKAPDGVAPRSNFAILWKDPSTGEWVDESATDPTLLAHVDWSGRVISRRLKHFSEYWFWFGLGSYNVTSGMGGGTDLWGGW